MRRSGAELAKYGIDAEAVFAEMDAALAEQTQTFLGNLREDVVLILLGSIPEFRRTAATVRRP